MKIKPEHYKKLKDAIDAFVSKHKDDDEFIEFYKNKSQVRYRWDMLSYCGLSIGYSHNNDDLPLYDYLDDSHIDTALKKTTGQTAKIVNGGKTGFQEKYQK